MIVLRLVLLLSDLPSYPPSLHGRYPLHRYYEDSDCCRASRDVPAPAALLCSRHSPCLTYGHQPLQHSPRQVPYLAVPVRCMMHRGFAIDSQARRNVVAESCSLLLLSVRFYSLLPTPPRGDAVTSSSRPEHGSSRPESSTPEGRDASQRTSTGGPAVVFCGPPKTLAQPTRVCDDPRVCRNGTRSRSTAWVFRVRVDDGDAMLAGAR